MPTSGASPSSASPSTPTPCHNRDRIVLRPARSQQIHPAPGRHRPHPRRSLRAAIPYTGSAIWTFGYRRDDIKHPLDAFGFLVPKAERRAIMACTWLQTKWLGRVPADKAVFRCFSSDQTSAIERSPRSRPHAASRAIEARTPLRHQPSLARFHLHVHPQATPPEIEEIEARVPPDPRGPLPHRQRLQRNRHPRLRPRPPKQTAEAIAASMKLLWAAALAIYHRDRPNPAILPPYIYPRRPEPERPSPASTIKSGRNSQAEKPAIVIESATPSKALNDAAAGKPNGNRSPPHPSPSIRPQATTTSGLKPPKSSSRSTPRHPPHYKQTPTAQPTSPSSTTAAPTSSAPAEMTFLEADLTAHAAQPDKSSSCRTGPPGSSTPSSAIPISNSSTSRRKYGVRYT